MKKPVKPVKKAAARPEEIVIERVQTGIRLEKRLLKVLKGLAEYHDLYLGDLLEGIVLHVFDGKLPFGPESLKRIQDLKKIYGLDLDSSASHKMIEKPKEKSVPALSKRAKRRGQV